MLHKVEATNYIKVCFDRLSMVEKQLHNKENAPVLNDSFDKYPYHIMIK